MFESWDYDPDAVPVRSGHFIGGSIVDDRPAIEVRRPSDSAVYGAIPEAGEDGVDRAVASARKAFRDSDWARIEPRRRARILHRWADLLEHHVDELAVLESLGSTRPVADARAWDVPFAAESLRFFAEYADKLGGDVAATRGDHLGFVASEPYGVVAAIAPWNLPLVMAAWKCGPALAAGNAVVLKPSELTPFSSLRFAEVAIEAGMPPGILNVVNGSGARTGEALVRHGEIGKITFTGSTRSGAAVMTAAAATGLKPVTLELGGKCPQIVFADASSIERTAAIVSRAILLNAGQVCVAGTRLLVQESIRAELVARIIEHCSKSVPGATWEKRAILPPIVSQRQAMRIDGIVKTSLAEGAEALLGGDWESSAPHYRPTVLAGVTSATTAVREEIFGPVLTVQSFADEEEAWSLAAHGTYGLAAGIHTADVNRALRAVRKLEAGTVWVNRYGRSEDFIIPTGGFKSSGIGKDLGRQAVEANLRHKSVLIDFS